MLKRPFLRWLSASAILGLIVPIANLLAWEFVVHTHERATTGYQNFQDFKHLYHRLLQVRILTWPTSILLMATDGIEKTVQGYVIVAISILANIFLYSVLGYILWAISRAIIKAQGKIQTP
jgi:hypothetical protein